MKSPIPKSFTATDKSRTDLTSSSESNTSSPKKSSTRALMVCRICETQVPSDSIEEHSAECALTSDYGFKVHGINDALLKLKDIMTETFPKEVK